MPNESPMKSNWGIPPKLGGPPKKIKMNVHLERNSPNFAGPPK